jgi:hypothetical protein
MKDRFTEEPYLDDGRPEILCVYERHPLTRSVRVVDFEWRGPVNEPVKVTEEHLQATGLAFGLLRDRFPPVLSCFPWPLRRVDVETFYDISAMYVRTDRGWRNWYYYAARARARRAWRWFFARLVWTLVVWGLAVVERGTFPTWGDVLKPQRESARWKRLKGRLRRRR